MFFLAPPPISPELLPGLSPRHQMTQGGKGGPGGPLLAPKVVTAELLWTPRGWSGGDDQGHCQTLFMMHIREGGDDVTSRSFDRRNYQKFRSKHA